MQGGISGSARLVLISKPFFPVTFQRHVQSYHCSISKCVILLPVHWGWCRKVLHDFSWWVTNEVGSILYTQSTVQILAHPHTTFFKNITEVLSTPHSLDLVDEIVSWPTGFLEERKGVFVFFPTLPQLYQNGQDVSQSFKRLWSVLIKEYQIWRISKRLDSSVKETYTI